MVTAGMYERSGEWLYAVGLPGKSGVSGGMVTVAPGKGGLGTYSPPLDEAGNSVRGAMLTTYLSQRMGLNLFASSTVSSSPSPADHFHAQWGKTNEVDDGVGGCRRGGRRVGGDSLVDETRGGGAQPPADDDVPAGGAGDVVSLDGA